MCIQQYDEKNYLSLNITLTNIGNASQMLHFEKGPIFVARYSNDMEVKWPQKTAQMVK